MISFFARHPTAANLLMLAIIIMGLSSLPKLPRETFPDFSSGKFTIVTPYPGASTEEVEQAICLPMEDAIDGIIGIKEISCEARENIATVTVEVVDNIAVNTVLNEVKTEVDALDNLPDLIEPAKIKEIGKTIPLITLAITADIEAHQLKAYAEQIKRKLKKLSGIAIIDVQGFSDQQLKVELAQHKLRQYGLSTNDITRLIQQQNIKLPSGDIKMKNRTLLVRVEQRELTAQKLANIVIKTNATGGQVKLKDIATISDGFELDEEKILFNGKRAAMLKIKKTKAQDALNLIEDIHSFVQQQQLTAPPEISLTLTDDSGQIVKDRLTMLLNNGWQGLALVIMVMWLFFSIRYSFWVSMGLPVCFLGAFYLMTLMGVSINMLSMVALLMAIGILMDDAIVIAESIASHVTAGQEVTKGAIAGVKTVSAGVFSSFLTTIAVFSGLAFLSGDIGKVLKVIPIVLIATILISIIEAFFILPHHLSRSLDKAQKNPPPSPLFKQKINHTFEQFRQVTLVRWNKTLTHYKYAFIGAIFALFLLSIAMMVSGVIKFKAFPHLEGDTVEAKLLMPASTPLGETEAIVSRFTQALAVINKNLSKQQPAQQPLIEHTTVEFNRNTDAYEQGAHLATIRVKLLTTEQRTTSTTDFINLWQQQVGDIAGIRQVTYKEPVLGPAGRAIEIRLHSEELATLMSSAKQIKAQLSNFIGVSNVMDDLRLGKEEWRVKLKAGALAYGVNGLTIARQLRAAYFGEIVDEVQIQGENVEIFVRLQQADQANINNFKQFPITLNNGAQIPLASIADFSLHRGVTRLNRVNGQRTLTITADVDSLLANTNEIIKQLTSTTIEPLLVQQLGLSISFEGEIKNGQETSQSMARAFLFGLIGVFIILSFQFKSYAEPIMVMLAIPLALIGVIWGHLLLGYDLSMPSMVGFVSLAGIVVNNSILLVTYIKRHQQAGMDNCTAAIMASTERFRAIFITSATTIAGTIPILFETNIQAQVVQPLITSIIFGILVSGILVLFVVPCLYMLLDDFGLSAKHHLNKPKPR